MLVAATFSSAQVSYISDRAIGVNPFSRGLIAQGSAFVRVCSSVDIGTTTSPCPDLAVISDINGIPLFVIGGNFGQLQTDIMGRFSFQCTSGTNLWLQIQSNTSNTPSSQYAVSCGGSGGGGGGGISRWDQLQNPTNPLTLSMGVAFNTTFNYVSPNGSAFLWQNTTPATLAASQGSPCISLGGQFWNGATSADLWQFCTLIASGTNGATTLNLSHPTGSTGFTAVQVPALIVNSSPASLPNEWSVINGVFPLTLPGLGNSAYGFDTDGKLKVSENNLAFYSITDAITAAAATRLNAVTAANASNVINSGDNAQIWNWALTTPGKTAFTFGEQTAASVSGTILGVTTLPTSNAVPFAVTQGTGPTGSDTPNALSVVGGTGGSPISSSGNLGGGARIITGAGGTAGSGGATGGQGGPVVVTTGNGGGVLSSGTDGGNGGDYTITFGDGASSGISGFNGRPGQMAITFGKKGTIGANDNAFVGFTINGTQPLARNTAGQDFGTLVNIGGSGLTGGNTGGTGTTAGTGAIQQHTTGNGGAGTGTNTKGGKGGNFNVNTGNGGVSTGTAANSNGGDVVVTLGSAGTGGSGAAGRQGIYQIIGGPLGVNKMQTQAPTTPTCAFTTGGGTSPSCSVDSGSSDTMGALSLSTGTGSPGNTGTVTITFNTPFTSANSAKCIFGNLGGGSGTWNARVGFSQPSGFLLASAVLGWDNNAVNLTASNSYKVNYICYGN